MTNTQRINDRLARFWAVLGYLACSVGICVIDLWVLPEEFADQLSWWARLGWGICLVSGGLIASVSAVVGWCSIERRAVLAMVAPLAAYGAVISVWALEGNHRGAQWHSAVLIVSVSAFLMLRRHIIKDLSVDRLSLRPRAR